MKWILLVFLLISCNSEDEDMRLFVSSLSSTGETPTPPFPENGVRVLIINGQSNALGVGANTDATTQELQPSTMVNIWRNDTKVFEPLQIGVNNVGSSAITHGQELGHGVNYRSITGYDDTLYIIKSGTSGACIDGFLSGGAQYNAIWLRVQEGINKLLTEGKRPFVYFSWIQGECDSNTQENTDLYSANFDALLSQWYTNLGDDIPWNCVQIYVANQLDTDINQVFINNAVESFNIESVDTAGFGDNGDQLHWSYSGQKEISSAVLNYMKDQTPIEITAPL